MRTTTHGGMLENKNCSQFRRYLYANSGDPDLQASFRHRLFTPHFHLLLVRSMSCQSLIMGVVQQFFIVIGGYVYRSHNRRSENFLKWNHSSRFIVSRAVEVGCDKNLDTNNMRLKEHSLSNLSLTANVEPPSSAVIGAASVLGGRGCQVVGASTTQETKSGHRYLMRADLMAKA